MGRPTLPPTESSLLEILAAQARLQPDRELFCFLEDGEFESEKFTYAQLDARARALSREILQGARAGDRVLLVYAPGLEFIAALFGCFYAGVIAVPTAPPRMDFQNAGVRRLSAIARDSQPALLLTGGELALDVITSCKNIPDLVRCRRIITDGISTATDDSTPRTAIGRETPALLQYTSGSTGEPRGVLITHGNILANQYVLQLAFHHRTAERPGTGVCWLPFYHDMGLIGNILQAVYVDAPCYLMSPLILLQRPLRWLEAISRYRAHSSGGPNFAFDLCVQRISEAQKKTLDLSCWELAAIGAEAISPKTIDRFSEAFAVCGFRREAFYPCYGLAEATVFVSGGDKEAQPVIRSFGSKEMEYTGEESSSAVEPRPIQVPREPFSGGQSHGATRTLVGCGHAWTDHELIIVNPRTCEECTPGEVGEIWFRGPSVAAGYWNQLAETERAFHASLRDSGRGPFLRTGDLGFIFEGELFVSGRLKDLIVIRGHNHYPQDIEETVTALHEAFRPNATVACGCPSEGEERLVIFQEIQRPIRQLDLPELTRRIRREVNERHQLHVHEVKFLRSGTIPRTTSGKMRRNECLRQYLQGQLTLWQPSS